MRRVALAALAAVTLALPVALADAREFPPPSPFTSIQLGQLGYGNTALRGPLVSADFFIPGPADFVLAKSSTLDLDMIPSELLAKESVMVVLWNGVPIHDRQIGGGTGLPQRVTIAIPVERIDPETNVLEIQAQLRLSIDTCEAGSVDSPARHVTILPTTTVRYSFADPVLPRPGPAVADLAKYPLPFFSATHPQPAPVRFVVPDRPSDAELTALARVAAQLGRFAGGRGVKVELQRASDVRDGDLDRTHTVLIGKQAALPLLRRLTNAPLAQDRDGRFLDERGRPIDDDTGVVMTMQAPWSAARGVLVVSGRTDDAVAKAGLSLSGVDAIGALRGGYALVPTVAPFELPSSTQVVTRLSDLGRKDEQVNGVGDHAIAFIVFLPAVARDASIPFDVAISHSGLLDQNRSSMRVLINDLPLESVAVHDLAPVHAVRRFALPGSALKPGSNTIKIEFSLRLPGLAERDACNAIPVEQAWVVLHADSAIFPPSAAGPASNDPDLAAYPYPFQRGGRLDDTLLVVPSDLGADPQALVQLLCELGRDTGTGLLRPTVVTMDAFDPARDAKDRDVIAFGLPGDDRLLGDLGARLPVEVGPDQRLLLTRDLTIRVADLERLGLLQEIASPWSPGRAVLVVTGTSSDGLDLAVEAIRQRNLSGNLVLASRQNPRPPAPGVSATPSPLAYGGPAPTPLDVSTYRLRPAVLAPQQEVRPPWVLIAAALLALVALIVAAAEGYEAFRAEDRT